MKGLECGEAMKGFDPKVELFESGHRGKGSDHLFSWNVPRRNTDKPEPDKAPCRQKKFW